VYCVFNAVNGFVNFIPYRIIQKKIVRNIIDFAMLNGRIGLNDSTYISPQGKSVVDYMCVPYEQLHEILDFKVLCGKWFR
jgi:hypothetical protein